MEKIKELQEISKPILEFLKNNYNPHTAVVISESGIKVVSDEISIPLIIHDDMNANEKYNLMQNLKKQN